MYGDDVQLVANVDQVFKEEHEDGDKDNFNKNSKDSKNGKKTRRNKPQKDKPSRKDFQKDENKKQNCIPQLFPRPKRFYCGVRCLLPGRPKQMWIRCSGSS